MIGQRIECEKEGCEVTFTKRTHNQRYHDAECTRLATNARLMRDYYDEQARKKGRARYCFTCESRLSRYNPTNKCNACSLKSEQDSKQSVVEMLSSVAFSA